MKKHFTLLMLLAVASVGSLSLSAANYQSLGMGWMTDDMITDLLDWQPVTYQVEILQDAEAPTHYRVVAPYGQAFAEAVEEVNGKILSPDQYDSAGAKYIDIDATDPDDVIFRKTYTGFDLGSGEIFIGINSRLNVTMKDGIISAPILGLAAGMGDSDAAIAVNRRGKFRIVLPGVELRNYDMFLRPATQCLTDRIFTGNLTLGNDVALVKYTVVPDLQEDEILDYVEAVADAGDEFTLRGVFSYTMDEVNKETLIMVGFNAEGEQVGYVWCSYYFVDQSNEGWTSLGTAEFTDGFLQDVIENIPSQTTACTLQRSVENPGRYRLVDPYAGLEEYPSLNAKHADHHHYIYINAETPDCIYVEESPIGLETAQYGLMRVSSMAEYFLGAGFEMEEVVELECGAIEEEGILTFPEEALLFSMLGYENGDWIVTDSDGATQIKLPQGVSLITGVKGISSDSDSNLPEEYFSLEGMKVANPQPGHIYIKRQGAKAIKIIK